MNIAIMAVGMFVGLYFTPRICAAVMGNANINNMQAIIHALGWTTVLVGAML
jgi:uncharacterized membrane protein